MIALARTRQAVAPLAPNWGHPLCPDIYLPCNEGGGAPMVYRRGAPSAPAAWSGTPGAAFVPNNAGAASFGGSSYVNLGDTPAPLASLTAPFSLAWLEYSRLADSSTAPGIASLFATGASGSQNFYITRFTSTPNFQFLFVGLGGQKDVHWSNATEIALGSVHRMLLIGRGGVSSTTVGDWELWQDGTSLGAPTLSGGGNLSNATPHNYFGWDAIDAKWTGRLSGYALWKRALVPTEAASYFANPHQFLPGQSTLRVASSGGTTYQSDVAETGGLADTIAGLLLLGASASESGTAADTTGGLLVLGASLSDSGTAADTAGGTLSLPGSTPETGTAADTVAGQITLAAALSESGSAADTPSGALVLPAAASEAGSVSDTWAGALVLPGSASEAGSLSDSWAGALVLIASLAESGSAQDIITGQGGASLVPAPWVLDAPGDDRLLIAQAASRVMVVSPQSRVLH